MDDIAMDIGAVNEALSEEEQVTAYVPVPGGYPQGPEETGAGLITSMTDTLPLTLYAVLGVICCFWTIFAFYRTMHGGGMITQGSSEQESLGQISYSAANRMGIKRAPYNRMGIKRATYGTIAFEESTDGLVMLGYRDSLLGTLFLCSLWSVSAIWGLAFLMMMVDQYWDCEYTGIDNTCFYGRYPIFGSYDVNETVFIWHVSFGCIWFSILVAYAVDIQTLSLIPAPFERSSHVWIQEEESVQALSTSDSCCLKLMSYFSERMCTARRTHSTLVPVRYESGGTKISSSAESDAESDAESSDNTESVDRAASSTGATRWKLSQSRMHSGATVGACVGAVVGALAGAWAGLPGALVGAFLFAMVGGLGGGLLGMLVALVGMVCRPTAPCATGSAAYIEYKCSRYLLQVGKFRRGTISVFDGPNTGGGGSGGSGAGGGAAGGQVWQLSAMEKQVLALLKIHKTHATGLSTAQAAEHRHIVGSNTIPFAVDSWCTLMAAEFNSFFYVYQLVVYVTWFWFSYLQVATLMVTVVLFSAYANMYVRRLNQRTIAKMTAFSAQVLLKRDGRWQQCDSEEMVPGDVCRLPSGRCSGSYDSSGGGNGGSESSSGGGSCSSGSGSSGGSGSCGSGGAGGGWIIPCDMVLLSGGCIVDESGLTGESMPVQKTRVPSVKEGGDPRHTRHKLYAGTIVREVQGGGGGGGGGEGGAGGESGDVGRIATAVVCSTGISTDKGQLVGKMLFPRPMQFKYDEELTVVIFVLGCYAAVCFGLSVKFMMDSGAQSSLCTKLVFGVMTVSQIMSPLIPVALVVGQTQSSKRLATNHGIYCLDPKRIAIAGKVRVFCFDKTGTLTTDGLDFLGVHVARNSQEAMQESQKKKELAMQAGEEKAKRQKRAEEKAARRRKEDDAKRKSRSPKSHRQKEKTREKLQRPGKGAVLFAALNCKMYDDDDSPLMLPVASKVHADWGELPKKKTPTFPPQKGKRKKLLPSAFFFAALQKSFQDEEDELEEGELWKEEGAEGQDKDQGWGQIRMEGDEEEATSTLIPSAAPSAGPLFTCSFRTKPFGIGITTSEGLDTAGLQVSRVNRAFGEGERAVVAGDLILTVNGADATQWSLKRFGDTLKAWDHSVDAMVIGFYQPSFGGGVGTAGAAGAAGTAGTAGAAGAGASTLKAKDFQEVCPGGMSQALEILADYQEEEEQAQIEQRGSAPPEKGSGEGLAGETRGGSARGGYARGDQTLDPTAVFATAPSYKHSISLHHHRQYPPLVEVGLASCHAVSSFRDDVVGNQVEVRMFKSTGWSIVPAVEAKSGALSAAVVLKSPPSMTHARVSELNYALALSSTAPSSPPLSPTSSSPPSSPFSSFLSGDDASTGPGVTRHEGGPKGSRSEVAIAMAQAALEEKEKKELAAATAATTAKEVVASAAKDVGPSSCSVTIIHRFEFDHALMTMSVLVQQAGVATGAGVGAGVATGGSPVHAYCKGSFEKVCELCDSATLPADYLQTAKRHALHGCYVLALCHKILPPTANAAAIARHELEMAGTYCFLGLLLFRNELRMCTTDTLRVLRRGAVRSVMITGDNAQCGFYIAKASGLLPSSIELPILHDPCRGGEDGGSNCCSCPSSSCCGSDDSVPISIDPDVDGHHLVDGPHCAGDLESGTGSGTASHVGNMHPRRQLVLVAEELQEGRPPQGAGQRDEMGMGGIGAALSTAVVTAAGMAVVWRQLDEEGEAVEGGQTYTTEELLERCGGNSSSNGRRVCDESSSITGGDTIDVGDIVSGSNKGPSLALRQQFEQAELIVAHQHIFDALDGTGNMGPLLLQTRIFSRMTPEGKVRVVAMHAERGIITGMCGDGGNDCGALRRAHVGVALSEAEASVVSAFTSKEHSVSSVVHIIREGRCCLATSFAGYKFLITYGQLFSMCKLCSFYFGVIMCQSCYFTIDIAGVLLLSYAITLSRPRQDLPPRRPTSSLVGTATVASVVGMQLINLASLGTAFAYMRSSPDYVRWPVELTEGAKFWFLSDNWECTILFTWMMGSFTVAALIFSVGGPFRSPLYTNYLLLLFTLCLVVSMALLLCTGPNTFTAVFHIASNSFNSEDSPSPVWQAYRDQGGSPSEGMSLHFRLGLWCRLLIGNVLVVLWELLVVQGPVRTYMMHHHAKPKLKLAL
jgi:magnesium-transporting ATPase (P-type)